MPNRLTDLYPASSHVASEKLDQALDIEVWEFARANGFTIVTKDADFGDLSVLLGVPPKILWLRLGNCTTGQIEILLRTQYETLREFGQDSEAAVLALL